MLNNNKKYINMNIKDHVIRYTVARQPELDSISDHGEAFFSEQVMEDGKVLNERQLQKMLDKLVKDKNWKNSQLRFCVPDAAITIREQLVPATLAKSEIKSYLHMELEEKRNLHLPFANPVIDFEILGKEDGLLRILLFAYPRERIDHLVSIFKKSGLKPVVADISSLSLYRLYHHIQLIEGKENLLTVQCDKDAMVLTAFNEAKPVFTRNIRSSLSRSSWTWQIGENELTWSGEQMEVDRYLEEQVITIGKFLDFYQFSVMDGTDRISKILLSGDYPFLKELKDQLKEQQDIDIQWLGEKEDILPLPLKYADILGLAIKNRKS
ncbi:type IV pilus biogenesis protein PilM [Sediminibacillus massiliensis]|uniref:type IV pilus biogenesis protein PilM n=1 Tax=Sediminibacillus massiliensis TaxID=1926277 RepID=UPI0009886ADF|nr:pilus assembly protein PilM [Sediminibacillus massiliensis]